MAERRPKNSIGTVQGSAKLMLKNIIQHTTTHNRLVEEAEMWKAYSKVKNSSRDDWNARDGRKRRRDEDGDRDRQRCNFNDPDVRNSFLYDDRQAVKGRSFTKGRSNGRAHMDSYDNGDTSDASPGGSTFWMRQLEKAEAADEDRWGHAGYKELYPQDFQSDRSVSSNSSNSSQEDSDSDDGYYRKRRKKKRKSSELSSRDKKHLKKKKKKREKREKSGKKKSSDDYQERREAKKRLKRKRKRDNEDSHSEPETGSKLKKQSISDRKESHRKKRRK